MLGAVVDRGTSGEIVLEADDDPGSSRTLLTSS
jgi:hypothetical protein